MRAFSGFMIAIVIVVVLSIVPVQPANADSTSVSVVNIAPEFAYVNVQRLNGHYNVKLTAADYNGWGDIADVGVEVFNAEKELDASFVMNQTDDGSGNRERTFTNTQSDWLDTSISTVIPWQDNTYRSLCWLNVSFIMLPSDGATMHMWIRDGSNATAEHWAPFTHEDVEAQLAAQLTVFASFIAATVVTAVVFSHRLGKNKILRELHEKAHAMGLNGNA